MFNYDILYKQVMVSFNVLPLNDLQRENGNRGRVDAFSSAQAEDPGSMQETASQSNP